MDKLLSIIIPVYNKSLFLQECIESINKLQIELNNIEAIFIDDCSTDDSLSILKEYEKKYDFIKLIKMDTNSGNPSVPRNVGIKSSNGTYLTFLDADDWLDEKGMPLLLDQAMNHNADIAFGQSIKHTNTEISKLGRFTSYKVINGIVPYEIDKIFRAVGPPGKIIKKSVVTENNIEFKNMKYGEDKLFFIEAISRCVNASMNDIPVYHVNRYKENHSLVGETDIIEKSRYNLAVLQELLTLKLPEVAEYQAISRVVEVDFMARLFTNERFLRNRNKDKFYSIFMEMNTLLDKHHKNIEDYIQRDDFKNMYRLLANAEYERFNTLISLLVKRGLGNRFVNNNQIELLLPRSLNDCLPITEECYAVYNGTHMIDGDLIDTIRLYKNESITINKVLLTGIHNDLNELEIDFKEEDNYIYLNDNDLEKCDFDFNITIIHSEFKPCVTNMNLPNASNSIKLNRQNFKSEFIVNAEKSKSKSLLEQYYTYNPSKVFTLKKINFYKDVDFTEQVEQATGLGEALEIQDIVSTKKGTPRLVTKDNLFITANKTYIKAIDKTKADAYLVDKVSTVKVIKVCNEYDNRNFKGGVISQLNIGDTVVIDKVVYTRKGTPRLQTKKGSYITANKKHVTPADN